MGVTTYTQEFTTSIAPSKMFKALILDSHNLIPKLMPQSIKSIEIIQGDGGAGSIKQTNFPEGGHFKFLKHRIDSLDKENYFCKYTLIEGDVLGDKLKWIVYEVKFEACGDGGAVCKMRSEYHTAEGVELKEEEIKQGKEKAMGMYKVVEAYLTENPHVYA
ncbi:PREDICTED: major allergen Pru ar 1-like [Nelumbo nucifera]|uniref:Major allergen Pru ar 1-like n=1 Tax=Nelumbo nucifera TaxID=4432 RepID=A0A1U7ZC49_NELNU|nr:PREDICTED: major allergen Pru ar 1-like [Nelumbo nucifera]